MRRITLGLIFGLLLVTLPSLRTAEDNAHIKRPLKVAEYIMGVLDTKFITPVEVEELVFKGLEASLNSLDPYTDFYDREQTRERNKMWSGILRVGIGVTILYRDGYIVVNSVSEGTPAAKNDFRVGDVIDKVNGEKIWKFNTGYVADLIKGEEGTEVTIELNRPLIGTLTKTLKRKNILNTVVPYAGMVNKEVGYIKIDNFFGGASDSVEAAYKRLKKENAKMLILDFRYNAGGAVKQAIKMANLFLPKDKVVYYKKPRYEDFKAYKTENEPVDTEIPIILLINEHSVSAAELVVGALQDHDRGVVVGTQSFGKGLVQQTWNTGDSTSMYFTIARYHTPLKRCIQRLDYANYSSGMKQEDIPAYSDDIKSEYKTKNGRKYLDFEGIRPDMEVKPKEKLPLIRNLEGSFPVFDFANYFRNTHKEIKPAREFLLADEYFEVFVDFVKKSDFNFNIPGQGELNDFNKIMMDNGYSASLQQSYAALKKSFDKEKVAQLEALKPEINKMLSYKIIGRFYSTSGKYQYLIDNTPEIVEAVKLFEEERKFRELLGE